MSPGIVREDGIALAPNVPGWGELDCRRFCASDSTAAVAVGNDVNAAAWPSCAGAPGRCGPRDPAQPGHRDQGGDRHRGARLPGANGAAGEIGYSLRDAADAIGFAHGRAPLEEFVGGRAIGERAGALSASRSPRPTSSTHPDPRAGELLDDALDALAVQVANMATALDPARIAVGGGLMSRADAMLAAREWR